ncbi:MAG: VWA domain-containing protein [Gammaproteobacteria bacterium]|nr:VWA domain-containing protein [Gammaproteobacteria bacterium]
MIQLLWPLVFLFLPLPFVVRGLLPPVSDRTSAGLRVPFYKDISQNLNAASGKPRWLLVLGALIWLLLLCALSRPQWLSDPVDQPKTGRDIMLAVDLSSSMEIEDFILNEQAVDRLEAVKSVVKGFIKSREGDRLGLILFGSKAYVQSPLSYDLTSVAQLLDEAQISMVGKQTAIGDAIGLAVKRLHNRPLNQRVLILLSDGNNTSGIIPAPRAAHFAALEGLRVYTIGIGARSANPLFTNKAVSQAAMLNETTLKTVAKLANGRYFRAQDVEELKQVYSTIDEMEKVVIGQDYYHHVLELYFWPLGAALLLSFLLALSKSQVLSFLKNETPSELFINDNGEQQP